MTDVFISYKKEDAGRVVRLVEAMRAEGLQVWWDHGIKAGSEWDRSIHRELYAARVVVAVWSKASVAAPWVKEEATVGKNRGVLVPVRIDDVEPPLGFMMIQAADLIGWTGDGRDPRWLHFLDAVKAAATGEIAPHLDAPLKPSVAPRQGAIWPWAAGGGGLTIAVLAALLAWSLGRDRAAPARDPVPPSAPPPVAIAPPPAPAPPVITAAEQALWDKAMAEKTRQGFQSYLLAYPNGGYAQRARDVLLTCRTETRESWREGPAVANQMLRGVGSTSTGQSREPLCEKAKGDVRDLARRLCETIVHNGGYRNPRWTVQDRDCTCEAPNARVTTCIADLPYSCLWDMKYTDRVEICGG